MLKLETLEHLQIHVQTICTLAREARAQRAPGVLEFLGPILKGLMPESALEGFREELKRIPARPVQTFEERGAAAVAELEAHIAQRDAAALTCCPYHKSGGDRLHSCGGDTIQAKRKLLADSKPVAQTADLEF